ncbi:MAG: hypothetical protein U0L11_10670 [Acutalibacteraceae bacterium]|nr:hypothetical protein [Acutalibacteraceae bacterium]
MKKNIYLAQINVTYSDRIAYLPYAAGCIAAYAQSDDEFNQKFNIGELLFLRENPDDALKRIENPFIVGFSCYIWNMEYNLLLARKIKEKYPECLIVFGGHNIPFNTEVLEKAEFVDALIHGEGERAFVEYSKAAEKNDFSALKNISYRIGGEIFPAVEGKTCLSLEEMPSPYTAGFFDKMIEDYPTIDFQATLETNRGCPYSCAFCDWCFTEKIRYFPMEKIKKEIDWMSDKKISYCYCADANFGISSRDIEVAQHVVDCNKKSGYPQIFKPCYAKNSDENIFEIGKLLNKNGVDKGVTLAYQSMSPEVLENIGRKNLDINYYSRLNALYSAEGIPTYTELILGLPGETYESFCNGLCSLLEAGQHNSITVYTCQVYCNSPLAQPEYKEKYGIRWERVPLHGIHYPANFNGVQEYYDIIVETKDMSKEEWVKANMFSVCLQSFHHLGLLRCFAIYSRYESGISYYEFYNRLLDYIYSDSSKYIYGLFNMIRSKTEDTENSDWCYQSDIFSKVGWYFEEGAFLDMAYNSDIFWQEIKGFVDSLGIDEDIRNALFDYQKSIIRLPDQETVVVESDYDFYNYFENIYEDKYSSLKKQKNKLVIELEKKVDSWAVYAREIIWFGKRRSATLCTNPREKIELSY